MRPQVYQFIEAPAFSRYREEYLDDDGFRKLQATLAANPQAGDIIPGAGAFGNCAGEILGAAKGRAADCELSITASCRMEKSGC